MIFDDSSHNKATLSKLKISFGVTSVIPPDYQDDFWCESPISFEVKLNDLKASLKDIADKVDSEVSAVIFKPNSCIKASYLSWLS